jgi:hypothetical protein
MRRFVTIVKYGDSTEPSFVRISATEPLSRREIKKVLDTLEHRDALAKVSTRSFARSCKERRNLYVPAHQTAGDDLSEIEMALESIKGLTKEDLKKKYAWVKQNA